MWCAICEGRRPFPLTLFGLILVPVPEAAGTRVPLLPSFFPSLSHTLTPSHTHLHTHTGDAEGKQSYTKSDCLRLAKTITDITQVPVPCQEVVKNEQAMRKAFEGATVTDRARQAIASRKGSVSHHQMQRRLTRTSEAMAR